MSTRDFFGERLLRPAELGTAIQRIVFTTYAALIGLALALAFQSQLFGPEVPTYVGYVLHLGIFWVGAVALTFAVIPLLAGAVHARTRWRYLIAAPVLIAVVFSFMAAPVAYVEHGSRYLWMYLVPLPFLIAGVLLVMLGARWRTRTVLWISAALAILFFISVMLATWWTGTLFGQTAFFLIVAISSVALMPAVMVVGFDLSEIACEASERFVNFIEPATWLGRVTGLLLPIAGLGIAVTLFATSGYTGHGGTYDVAIWVALLTLATVATFAFASRRDADSVRSKAHIHYLQAVIVAIPVCVFFFVAISFTEITPGYVGFDDPLPFSLKLPAGMTAEPHAAFDPEHPTLPGFYMTTHGHPPTLAVIGIPRSWHVIQIPKTINDLIGLRSLSAMPLRSWMPTTNGWSEMQASARNKRGHAIDFFVFRWEDQTLLYRDAATWYVVCGGTAKQAGQVQSMCESVRRSFSTGHYIADGYRQSRAAMLTAALVLLAAAAALLFFANRDHGRPHALLLNFFAWVTFLTGLRCAAGYLFGGVEDPLEDLKVAMNLVTSLLIVTALAALLAKLWPRTRARSIDISEVRRVLGVALLSTLLMTGIFYLYVIAIGTGEHSTAIRGIIIVIVLSWELATAGGTLNPNREHHVFPRTSRVLIFAGYLVLVATCVFSFSGGSMAGRAVEGFDTESLVANGIVILGGGLVISRALRQLMDLRRAPPSPESLPTAEPMMPVAP